MVIAILNLVLRIKFLKNFSDSTRRRKVCQQKFWQRIVNWKIIQNFSKTLNLLILLVFLYYFMKNFFVVLIKIKACLECISYFNFPLFFNKNLIFYQRMVELSLIPWGFYPTSIYKYLRATWWVEHCFSWNSITHQKYSNYYIHMYITAKLPNFKRKMQQIEY